jgi:uncharacterized membrane protein YccF (DUF307 family)
MFVLLITGLLMCLTIIGIPRGLADFKLIPVSVALRPGDRGHRAGAPAGSARGEQSTAA